MKLFVLGASGQTGRLLITQGLTRGHAITAFGRSRLPDGVGQAASQVSGNPLNADELAFALGGHDAVLSALGTRGLGRTTVLVESARALVAAMPRAGVRRLIVLSSSLVDTRSGWLSTVLSRTLVRHVAADQRAMERLIASSPFDWTVLRPARLDHGAHAGRYAASAVSTGRPSSGAAMSRSDLASLILDATERAMYIKEIVWVRGARA